MADFEDIGDLYNLNDTNTKLYKEHQEWYDEYKANSIGDLIDRQADIIDRYERVMDHSTTEINELKDENATNEKIITELEKEVERLEYSITQLEEEVQIMK